MPAISRAFCRDATARARVCLVGMGAAIGTESGKSSNIELNIIPFVDVMSCLTAFLLVAAVWIPIAQEQTAVAGKCPAGSHCDPDSDHQWLGILVEADRTSVLVLPGGEARQLPSNDWAGVRSALRALAPQEHAEVQIAAASTKDHPITYQTLVTAMDTAVSAGFSDVRITDADTLMR